MSALIKFVEVHGFEVDVTGEEPTVLDVTLGAILGYQQPRNIRRLIERHIGDLPGIRQASQLTRVENAGNLPDTITVEVYHLNEEHALFLAARADTPTSTAMLKEFISIAVKMRKALIERASTPSMTAEAVALLASRVAAETTAGILATRKTRKRALTLAQERLFPALAEAKPVDAWEGAIKAFLGGLAHDAAVTIGGVAEGALALNPFKLDRHASTRIGMILSRAGWARSARPWMNGQRVRQYRRVTRGEA